MTRAITRAPLVAALTTLALLLALIGVEWWHAASRLDILDAPIVRGAAGPDRPGAAAEVAAPPVAVDQWTRVALARPLMSSSRHAIQTGSAISLANGLPRLTGTLTGQGARSAIFARDDAGHPMVVHEGGTLGPYTVSRIAPNRVTLRGPAGEQTLRPRFSSHPADPDPGNDGAPTTAPMTLPGVMPGVMPGGIPGVVPQLPNQGHPFRLQQLQQPIPQ